VSDATPEALALRMHEQGGRIALISPEGGSLFEMVAGRYSDSPAIEVYLHGHAGEKIAVDRIKRDTLIIYRSALTVGIASQPATLRSLASNPALRGRGLVARFMYSVPVSNIGYREIEPPPVSHDAGNGYRKMVRSLIALPYAAPDERGDDRPHDLVLSPNARELWRGFARHVEEGQRPDGYLAKIGDWATKYAGLVGRLAGLFHLADLAGADGDAEPWKTPIEAETLERAMYLGEEYLVPHARIAMGMMYDSEHLENARRLVAWVRKSKAKVFSVRDAYRALGAKGRREEVADPVLELLVAHGYIRVLVTDELEGAPRQGRPKGVRYCAHPDLQ
jgi:replicative DNA helicase